MPASACALRPRQACTQPEVGRACAEASAGASAASAGVTSWPLRTARLRSHAAEQRPRRAQRQNGFVKHGGARERERTAGVASGAVTTRLRPWPKVATVPASQKRRRRRAWLGNGSTRRWNAVGAARLCACCTSYGQQAKQWRPVPSPRKRPSRRGRRRWMPRRCVLRAARAFSRRCARRRRSRLLAAGQVASAVAALKKHLAKEAAAKNGLFEEDDMFNLVRPPRRAASRPHCLGKLVGRPPPARAGRSGRRRAPRRRR